MPWRFFGRPRKATEAESVALLRRAVAALAAEDSEAAEEALSLLVRGDSGHSDAYLALGRLYRQRGDIGRAIRLHQNLLLRKDLTPALRAEALAGLAEDLAAGGFERRAVAAYRELVALQPRRIDALEALMALRARAGDYREARSLHRRLEKLRRQPDPGREANLLVAEARSLRDEGEEAKARRLLRRASRLDDTEPSGPLLLAELEALRGRNRAARSIWRSVVESGGGAAAQALRQLAAAGSGKRAHRDHESFLRARLERAPRDTTVRLELARLLVAHGEIDEGLGELRKLLDAAPQDLRARVELGQILLAEGRHNDALKEFEELLAVLENLEGATTGEPE